MRLRDLNSGFSNPETDLAGLLRGVAAGRAHRRALHGEPALRELVRVVRRRPRHRGRRSSRRWRSSIDDAAEDLRRVPRRAVRRAAQGARHARGLRGRRAARAAAGPGHAPIPAASRCRWRSAGRCEGADPDAALAAYERAAALVPDRHRRRQPAGADRRADPRSAATRRGAARALETLTANDHTDVASARQLVGLLDQPADTARRKAALAKRGRRRSVRCRGAHRARPLCPGRRQRAGGAAGRSASRLPPGPRTGPAPTPTSARRSRRPGDRAEAKRQALARPRGRAVLRAGAGPAAAAGGAAAVTAAVPRDGRRRNASSAASARLMAAAVALIAFVVPAVSSLAREAVAQAGVFKEDRLAGLQWTFVRVKYTPTTGDLAMRTALRLLGRPLGHRRAGGRAEPVAPAADGHRHRGRRAAGDEPRRPRLWQYPGCTSSSRATSC